MLGGGWSLRGGPADSLLSSAASTTATSGAVGLVGSGKPKLCRLVMVREGRPNGPSLLTSKSRLDLRCRLIWVLRRGGEAIGVEGDLAASGIVLEDFTLVVFSRSSCGLGGASVAM